MMAPNTTRASTRHATISNAEWLEGVSTFHDECAGVMEVAIIDSMMGARLLAAAVMGSQESALLLQAVKQAAAQVKNAPRRTPALCIGCPRCVKRITPRTVFGVALPSTPNPTGAMGFVFCDRCAEDPAGLPAKATEGVRRLWPEARPIKISYPEGGRA
jgi:hypothetical protein